MKIIFILATLIFMAVALRSCAGVDHSSGERVKPSAVVQSAVRLSGKLVKVRGYLDFGAHSRVLWDSERSAIKGDFSSCITLTGTSRFSDTLSKATGSVIKIEGIVKPDVLEGVIDLGACNKVGLEVVSVEEGGA